MNKKKRIAIFASGGGSNAENIITYFAVRQTATVAMVLTDVPDAGVVERAERLGVPLLVFPLSDLRGGRVMEILKAEEIDFVVLAGFLRMIPQEMTREYHNKIVNIHPSLLPKYGGKGMYGMNVHRAVVENGEKETGITIHHVNEHYDSGDVVFQTSVALSEEDTAEDVAAKVAALEMQHFPVVIESLLSDI